MGMAKFTPLVDRVIGEQVERLAALLRKEQGMGRNRRALFDVATRMAEKTFKKGDKVAWDSSGGHSVGKVVSKVTGTSKVKGHTAKASKDNTQYKVESDKSGKEAIHKAASLKKA